MKKSLAFTASPIVIAPYIMGFFEKAIFATIPIVTVGYMLGVPLQLSNDITIFKLGFSFGLSLTLCSTFV